MDIIFLIRNNKPPYHGSLKRKIASNLTNKLHFFDRAWISNLIIKFAIINSYLKDNQNEKAIKTNTTVIVSYTTQDISFNNYYYKLSNDQLSLFLIIVQFTLFIFGWLLF